MGVLSWAKQQAERAFGLTSYSYDATEDNDRRRPPRVRLMSEDNHLDPTRRRKLVATTRDIGRNFEVAAWVIRKHLDYVATFDFQSQNGGPLDDRIHELVDQWSKPDSFDAAGKHGRRRFTRLAEARRVIDGDFFAMKLKTGLLQAIEGDRIRSGVIGAIPPGIDPDTLVHGVQVTETGRPLAYCLCNRNRLGDGFTFDRLVPAVHMQALGYYDRFDQTRGISPLAAAVNRLEDSYEGLDLALAKAKVTQLFALAIFSERIESPQSLGPSTADDDTDEADTEAEEDAEKYPVDFKRGPIKLELDPGDDAKFLESSSPSTEFQSFTELCIRIALLSLDIPYTFLDCTKANYSAARQDLLLYEESAAEKRNDLREWLDALLTWRLRLWILDGTLQLPRGTTLANLKWEWIPKGLPWIDPVKETTADALAVQNGFSSTVRVCRERGRNAYQVCDEQAEYLRYRQEKLKGLAPLLPVSTGRSKTADSTTNEPTAEPSNAA